MIDGRLTICGADYRITCFGRVGRDDADQESMVPGCAMRVVLGERSVDRLGRLQTVDDLKLVKCDRFRFNSRALADDRDSVVQPPELGFARRIHRGTDALVYFCTRLERANVLVKQVLE